MKLLQIIKVLDKCDVKYSVGMDHAYYLDSLEEPGRTGYRYSQEEYM